jgi:hypothetical protein
MGRAKNMLTPEQQYQADREQAWRAENAKPLAIRADLRAAGASRGDLDRHLPLTTKPTPITDKPKPKKRWGRQ